MNNYVLGTDRIAFIDAHLFEWSFNKPHDTPPPRDKFDQLKHPAELFYLAQTYNWDDGPSVIEWIVDSPLCARATANLIFWRAAPDYYRRYDLDRDKAPGEEDENLDVLRILRKIIRRHERDDFSGFDIAFDPAPELETQIEKNPKWDVPPALYSTLEGAEILMQEPGPPDLNPRIVLAVLAAAAAGLLAWWLAR